MIYLIDTNVLSETMKKIPDQKVLSWLDRININNLSLSVMTLGEIRKGAERIPETEAIKKQRFIQWLEIDIPKEFEGRIIDITSQVSDKWGYISSISNIPTTDGLIAASALVHNQKLVTRNVKDFKDIPGLEIINPWEL